jgi:hypothetical protein
MDLNQIGGEYFSAIAVSSNPSFHRIWRSKPCQASECRRYTSGAHA